MTNQQILTKAIEKAQKNGFMPERRFEHTENMGWTMVLREKPRQTGKGLAANITYMQSEFDIIFNPDFAQALWGKELDNKFDPPIIVRANEELKVNLIPAFQFHLQQMVIADDKIKYLGENL